VPVVPRRLATSAPKDASSRLTTAIGLPSWRAKSIASRTMSATSMAFAM
jgi:hypothetical protein